MRGMPNIRPEWRGAEREQMQTGRANPRPLQATRYAIGRSCSLTPPHEPDARGEQGNSDDQNPHETEQPMIHGVIAGECPKSPDDGHRAKQADDLPDVF